jgi:hypothetical protein
MDQVLARLLSTRPVAYWTLVGAAATAEAALSLWASSRAEGDRDRALSACRAIGTYASIFPIGRPSAALWEAAFARLADEPVRARRALHRAVAEAERLDMPYERALAFLELARLAPPRDPEREALLVRAEAILTDLGAPFDAAEARREMGR